MESINCNYEVTSVNTNGVTRYGIRLTSLLSGESECIPDISCDLEKVTEFAKLLEQGQVTRVTFFDCVEDFIAEL